ncbi:MAG: ATP-binding cassette domain-containing protein [Pseudomonadota bacterium]
MTENLASGTVSDPDMTVVLARDLTKRFDDMVAVAGISFIVSRGECVGLLGPNGAGKTTTMRMLMGLSHVSAGTLELFGEPVATLRRDHASRIGLVPQDDNLDPDITVQQNLELYGHYFGVAAHTRAARVPELLEFMQLEERAEARVNELSGGMKRRLVIARSLIADPELVVLDEPTTGLDPQARVLIWKQLLELKRQGRTLLLTTHYMDEAQRLCDRIIIVDAGEILAEGAPQTLIDQYVLGHVFEVPKPLPDTWDHEAFDHEDIGDAVLIYVEQVADFVDRIPAATHYLHRQANLEDVFLRLTGRALREN